jgi:hypothetical protein
MAQGLKIGDKVTPKGNQKLKADPQNAENSLKRLKEADVATVVGKGTGRAFIVEFKGKRGEISAQQLLKYEGGQSPDDTSAAEKAATTVPKDSSMPSTVATHSADFGLDLVNLMANKLLLNGGIRADAEPVVELRLAELPPQVEKTLRALLQAKLSLGVQALATAALTSDTSTSNTVDSKPKAKRGRPPKKPTA